MMIRGHLLYWFSALFYFYKEIYCALSTHITCLFTTNGRMYNVLLPRCYINLGGEKVLCNWENLGQKKMFKSCPKYLLLHFKNYQGQDFLTRIAENT